MCGIAGAVGTWSEGLIGGMTASLRHRGPDGRGHSSAGQLHVGATRLSIVDPASGAQPVYNETGRICVVFNGEIYNYKELRADLIKKGHVFRTGTDTEVLVHLYEEEKDDCVRHVHGMFAFAIMDGPRIFLARDRLGIKPIYYSFDPDQQLFLFASEIKVILQHSGSSPRLNLQTLADSIVIGHPLGTETFFDGVHSLAPGHTMAVLCGGRLQVETPRPYFTRNLIRNGDMALDEAQERLEAALESAIESHLAADVEVGLTLSGGLDSAVLAFLAHEQLRRPMLTFTVGDHPDHPDVVQARLVAKTIESRHRTLLVTFDEYLAAIPGLVAAEEQPSSLYGIPFYLLCREIAQHTKACLHGEGADELFGGYREYTNRESRTSYIRHQLPILTQLGVAPSSEAILTIRRLSSAIGFDEYLQNLFEINLADPLERQHLVPVDKCSMATGLEIRVPYLDDSVFDLVTHMPLPVLVRSDIGVRKYVLRRLALKRFGLRVFDVILRDKLGAPASGIYLLNRFDKLCNEVLPDSYVTQHDFGFCFSSKRQLFLFDLFIEVFMKHRGDGSAIGSVVEFLHERAEKPRAAGFAQGYDEHTEGCRTMGTEV